MFFYWSHWGPQRKCTLIVKQPLSTSFAFLHVISVFSPFLHFDQFGRLYPLHFYPTYFVIIFFCLIWLYLYFLS